MGMMKHVSFKSILARRSPCLKRSFTMELNSLHFEVLSLHKFFEGFDIYHWSLEIRWTRTLPLQDVSAVELLVSVNSLWIRLISSNE